jgi:hypothetical protein
MGNIKIIAGNPIPAPQGNRKNYTYAFIDFNGMEHTNCLYDPEQPERHEDLKKKMYNKQQLLWIKPIGGNFGTGCLDPGDSEINVNFLSVEDKERYNNLPCAIPTPAGTIIPQIIVPSETYEGIDNGIYFGTDETMKAKDAGYNWIPVQFSTLDQQGNPVPVPDSDDRNLYGIKSNYWHVTNENGTKRKFDHPVYATREYNCNLTTSEAKSGSCAICYKHVFYNGVNDGTTPEEKMTRPSLLINLAGNIVTTNSGDDNGNGGGSGGSGGGAPPEGNQQVAEPNAISVLIPPTGEIIGAVASNVSKSKDNQSNQGSMSVPCNDIMPPQCIKDGSDYLLYPMYFYPLYSGLVITNSILNSAQTGGDKIFIKYNEEIKHPIYTVDVKGVEKSQEAKDMLKADKASGSELMQWFPSLFQETRDKENIRLLIPEQETIKFGDIVNIKWTKSVGKFAYCPLFFHRSIKMTLFFKGEYRGGDTGFVAKGKYYVYPLVFSNVFATQDDNAWSGLNKQGAKCITNARYVCSDTELQESIYAVDLEFTASEIQRYPIELFGIVLVYERNAFQFTISNSNGNFLFEKPVFNQFTGLVEQQTMLNKQYLGLMTSLSVSSSLDGVSGQFSMDGYPLMQGIKTFKQTQSIGEADFAIYKDGYVNELCKGYAMELSTSDSESSYAINAQFAGVNKKMEDMKLICAPFWDGDRLEMICAYFEAYLNLKIKMIDYTVTNYNGAKSVSNDLYGPIGTWCSESHTIINNSQINHPVFRVPRSCDWRSPSVNFNSGTTCMEALKKLGEMTGCVCIPQLDGTIVYYELNNYGFPFYVWNQKYIVEFQATDIISISLSPSLENKYNSIATFGFLAKKDVDGKVEADDKVQHGAFYSNTLDGTFSPRGVQFPWSRASVGVESAMFTRAELMEVHINRIKMMTAEIYKGTVQVWGNTKVNHIYQRIRICGINFFVISIDHEIDAAGKTWTTSYGIQCIDIDNEGNPVSLS